jgi:CRISPR-associated protein Cmr4
MSVTDARILFMPVRSLTTHFRYVTCPALLKRFKKDLARLGFSELTEFTIPTVTADEAVCEYSQNELYLEEFLFQSETGDVDDLISSLSVIFSPEVADEVKATLTIISDDQFRHIVRAATPLQARIAIENENKVVKGGALWYEESLPPETIMYTTLSTVSGRGNTKQSAEVIRNSILDQVFDKPYLQVGGNETVGMGWFQVMPYTGKEGA